jgi:hypothetical protein
MGRSLSKNEKLKLQYTDKILAVQPNFIRQRFMKDGAPPDKNFPVLINQRPENSAIGY